MVQPLIETAQAPQDGLGCDQLSRCRLRIFRNGSLGRSHDWAVLITELPSHPQGAFERSLNPGAPAHAHLDQLATEIKSLHLPRFPAEQVAWFYHQPNVVSADRPQTHHVLDRVDLRRWNVLGSKALYFGYALEPISPEDLELCAGGLVEL